MRKLRLLRVLGAATIVGAVCGLPAIASGQTPAAPVPASGSSSAGSIGIAVRVSSLGIGGDVALRLSEKANIRAGMDTFSLSRDFVDGNTTYAASIKLQSVHAFLDWFPMGGGFHISPGVVFANNSKATLNGSIAPGQRVTIGNSDFVGGTTNPLRATGEVALASTAAALTIGWGNMVPQGHRFSVPFEIGITMGGTPTSVLAFTGTACATNGTNCRDAATDPTIQAEVRNQQTKLSDALNKGFARFYPVLSIGLGIRF